ncbi:hypothetical protein ACIOD2_27150 [Amycolatopsis sp. NPDC088138]
MSAVFATVLLWLVVGLAVLITLVARQEIDRLREEIRELKETARD